jgi:hypothetical protein
VVTLVFMLGAAILGGVRGARAEARSIGLRAVYPPGSWPDGSPASFDDEIEDVRAFERRFLSDS